MTAKSKRRGSRKATRAWSRKEALKSRGICTYDIFRAQIVFSLRALATLESAWNYPNVLGPTVDSFIEAVEPRSHIQLDRSPESMEMNAEENLSYPKSFINAEVSSRRLGALPVCLKNFHSAIRRGTIPHATVVDGHKVTATLDAIHLCLESGQTGVVTPLVEVDKGFV